MSYIVVVFYYKHYAFRLIFDASFFFFTDRHRVIQMDCIGVNFICGDSECENRTCPKLALNIYLTVVKLYQRLDQCESYTCTRSLMPAVGLKIAFENMGQRLFINAIASIGNTYFCIAYSIVMNYLHRNTYLPMFRIFYSI